MTGEAKFNAAAVGVIVLVAAGFGWLAGSIIAGLGVLAGIAMLGWLFAWSQEPA